MLKLHQISLLGQMPANCHGVCLNCPVLLLHAALRMSCTAFVFWLKRQSSALNTAMHRPKARTSVVAALIASSCSADMRRLWDLWNQASAWPGADWQRWGMLQSAWYDIIDMTWVVTRDMTLHHVLVHPLLTGKPCLRNEIIWDSGEGGGNGTA